MDPGTSGVVVEFEDRGSRGRVSVTCVPNVDPSRWGYPLLGLPVQDDVARGFPVLRAGVETDAEGYGSILAWVQVLSILDLTTGSRQEVVDVAPQLQGLEVPYVSFGPRPSLFDAPSTDAPGDVDWSARTFLVAAPDCAMTRQLVPLCGFGWGYEVRGRRPTPTALTEVGQAEWAVDRELLAREHPSWTFDGWPA